VLLLPGVCGRALIAIIPRRLALLTDVQTLPPNAVRMCMSLRAGAVVIVISVAQAVFPTQAVCGIQMFFLETANLRPSVILLIKLEL